jgi:hypothetical protein
MHNLNINQEKMKYNEIPNLGPAHLHDLDYRSQPSHDSKPFLDVLTQ